MTRALRRLYLIAAAASTAVLATCVTHAPPSVVAEAAERVTQIRVVNHDLGDVDVWLLDGEAKIVKLGTISGMSTHDFFIKEHLYMGQEIALYARSRMDGTAYKSDRLGAVPGLGWIWRIGDSKGSEALLPLYA